RRLALRRGPARSAGERRLRRLARLALRRRGAGRRGRKDPQGARQGRLRRRRDRRRRGRDRTDDRPHTHRRPAGRHRARGRAGRRPPPGDRIPVLPRPHPRRRAAGPAAPPRPAHRAPGLRHAPPAGRPDDRPDRPHLPARWPLVRARLEIQPPARLRPRAARGRHGAQRIPPAGADLHPRPAPLAALPPGRALRLRTRLRRRPLPVLPRHRFRKQGRAGHPGLALRSRTRARARRPARRRNQRGRRMSLLQALAKSGALRTLDHALAQSLRRLDPDTPDAVLAAVALASLAVSAGHAGFDPAEPQRLVEEPIDWPTPETWRRALESSRWVACPQSGDAESPADAPLVFEHGLVYLRRYREYERRLAEGLRRLGGIAPDSTGAAEGAEGQGAQVPAHLADLFAELFPEAASGEDLQAQAAAAALHHNLLLVT